MKRRVVGDIREIIQQKRPANAGVIKQQGNQRNERGRHQPIDNREDAQREWFGQDVLRLVYAWAGSLVIPEQAQGLRTKNRGGRSLPCFAAMMGIASSTHPTRATLIRPTRVTRAIN